MQITLTKDFQGMAVYPQLQEFVDKLFAVRPSLEFVASACRRTHEDVKFITEVDVFEDDQKLGAIGWTMKWSRVNGNEFAYYIYSRNINNNRGDKHAKRTKNLTSAMRVAVDVLVKDTSDKMAAKISTIIRSQMEHVVWQVTHKYRDKKSNLYEDALEYVLSVIEGGSPAISDNILQAVSSEKFQEAQNNFRIANSVASCLAKSQGAIVFVDRKQRLTFIDVPNLQLQRLESTYDLPKEYQEKYAILKIMENRQPIQNVGIRIDYDVGDDEARDYFYMTPGDIVTTH